MIRILIRSSRNEKMKAAMITFMGFRQQMDS